MIADPLPAWTQLRARYHDTRDYWADAELRRLLFYRRLVDSGRLDPYGYDLPECAQSDVPPLYVLTRQPTVIPTVPVAQPVPWLWSAWYRQQQQRDQERERLFRNDTA